jgi:hypothetical protein
MVGSYYWIIIFTLVQILLGLKANGFLLSTVQELMIYGGIFLGDFAFWYLLFRYIAYGTMTDYTIRTPWTDSLERDKTHMCTVESFQREVTKNMKSRAQLRHLVEYFSGSTWQGFVTTFLASVVTTILLAVVLDYAWFEHVFRCLTSQYTIAFLH